LRFRGQSEVVDRGIDRCVLVEMIVYCLALGVIAGVLAGLFGIGGGIIIVPSLLVLFSWQGFEEHLVMVMAVATSLATIVVTSIASIHAHWRLGNIEWPIVQKMAPMVFIGAVIGAWVAHYISGQMLKVFFAFFLIYVGLNLLRSSVGGERRWRLIGMPYSIGGGIIGLLSSSLGIGGGTLTVPYLVYMQRPMPVAVGVSSACGLPIAVASSISYIVLGWGITESMSGFLGYIYLPAFVGVIVTSVLFAPIGAKMATKLPVKRLQQCFSVLLLLVGIRLLV